MFRQETHPRRREKYREQHQEPTGLPWELRDNPGNSHPSAPQGEQEQPGFPGVTQNKDSPKAVPTFRGRTSLRSSPWKCPREQPCPGGENRPPGHRNHRNHFQDLPWALGRHPAALSRGDRATGASIPQEAAQNPFCFPVPSPGSTLGSSSGCTAQTPQPQ